MKNLVYLSLGSNIPDKKMYLQKGIEILEQRIGKVLSVSSVYETDPWGFSAKESFYNMALLIETAYTPEDTLSICLNIETGLGRTRSKKGYDSRTLDIDILFFNQDIISSENLNIPHPHIPFRNFVLIPLAEIAPKFLHPILHTSIHDLFRQSKDTAHVKNIGELYL